MTQSRTPTQDAVQMTLAEWHKTHRDFKTTIDGQRYVSRWTVRGTGLVPVVITKEQRQ